MVALLVSLADEIHRSSMELEFQNFRKRSRVVVEVLLYTQHLLTISLALYIPHMTPGRSVIF